MRKTHGFAVTSVERSEAKRRLTCTRARLLLTTLYCSWGSSTCPVLAWAGRGDDLSPLGVAEGVPPPWRPQQVSGGPLTAARADGPAGCQRATRAGGWGHRLPEEGGQNKTEGGAEPFCPGVTQAGDKWDEKSTTVKTNLSQNSSYLLYLSSPHHPLL